MSRGASAAGDPLAVADLMPIYTTRAAFTETRWEALHQTVAAQLAKRTRFQHVFDLGVCYVTGSMARDEANAHSDLDVFLVDELPIHDEPASPDTGDLWTPRLTGPDQAHFLSAVDESRELAEFRTFSRAGQFLKFHSFRQMVREIGNAEDDFSNRFTARMLLLLNSRPLINTGAYHRMRSQVLDQYWRQETDPAKPFYPIFLLNDIKRWWGILLLNFEYQNPPADAGKFGSDHDRKRAKRRVQNLKLRYARLLAAYSPILGILAESSEDGITRERLLPILDASPIARMSALRDKGKEVAGHVNTVLRMYDEYLNYMDAPKDALLTKVLDDHWSRDIKQRAYQFGDLMSRILMLVGEEKVLYRYVQI